MSLDDADYALGGGVSSSESSSNIVNLYSGFEGGGYGYEDLQWAILDEYELMPADIVTIERW